jgi:colanic acid/amylovoran biosynthesis protein
MFIQIDYANYINKGAELMLYAIMDQLESEIKDVEFVLGNSWYSRKDLGNSDLYKKLDLKLFGYSIDRFLHGKYRKFAEKRGLVRTNEIKVVLNAAGYYYRDGSLGFFESEKKEINYYQNLKRNKSKVILMPQAFGPLETKESQRMLRNVFQYVDLAFARDEISYKALIKTLDSDKKVKLAPDFTNIYKPKRVGDNLKNEILNLKKYAVIVPNFNMLKKISEAEYLELLTKIANYLLTNNTKIIVLNHEREGDRPLINKISQILGNKIIIKDFLNADEVKYIISNSYLTITSRFHGYVSGLSSCVPTLCTSWSHKYEELSKNYHLEDSVLDPQNFDNSIRTIAKYLENHQTISQKLAICSEIEKKKTREMWQEVKKVILS